jgi:hypothetical protein
MNSVINRKITLTGGYQPLAATRTIASVTISCPPTNSGPVYFRGDDGTDVPWLPAEWHEFKHVDLSQIRVWGNYGDLVTVVGGTW